MKLAVAERLARSEKLRAATDSKGLPGGVEVFCSDFRRLGLPDASVDLIFTDPPWYMPELDGDLARFAARVLKPGRLCCVYASAAALPEVIARMGRHLDYYWCLAVGYQNASCHRYAVTSFTVTWTPVLAFRKGPLENRAKHAPLDFLSTSCGRTDKTSHHRWRQEGEPARSWLERLTLPGDRISTPSQDRGSSYWRRSTSAVGRSLPATPTRRQRKRPGDGWPGPGDKPAGDKLYRPPSAVAPLPSPP
jgi:hypothetical protein